MEENGEESGGPINERRISTFTPRLTSTRRNDWKSRLARLRDQSVSGAETEARGAMSGREVLYILDVARTLEGDGAAIDVATRDFKRDGRFGRLRFDGIRREQVALLPDAADREILSLLGGAAYRTFGFGHQGDARYQLNAAMVAPMLKRMCQTGRLRLRTTQMAHEDSSEERDAEGLITLSWDEGPPWAFAARVEPDPERDRLVVSGELRRTPAGETEFQRMPLAQPEVLLDGGLLVSGGLVSQMDDGGAFGWIALLREGTELAVPTSQADELLEELMSAPQLPPLQLPPEYEHERVQGSPKPQLRIVRAARGTGLEGKLGFEYDGATIVFGDRRAGIYQPALRRMVLRDVEAERRWVGQLKSAGFKSDISNESAGAFSIAPTAMAGAVRRLTADGWHVEADGKLYRQAGTVRLEVKGSGIDWFELHGSADFDGQSVSLPRLLSALRKGDRTVVLGDGSLGVLPEQWLKQYGGLASLGTDEGDVLKFTKSQIGLLDALLASQPQATCDEVFEHARDQLLEFKGVQAASAPEGFIGLLRPYQEEGLGWMQFLRKFNFGGCLADDMGLGKTVQVLALLMERKAGRLQKLSAGSVSTGSASTESASTGSAATASASTGAPSEDSVSPGPISAEPASGQPALSQPGDVATNLPDETPAEPAPDLVSELADDDGDEEDLEDFEDEAAEEPVESPGFTDGDAAGGSLPSLVVAPRSLIFNWLDETRRFAPQLRVLDHTGVARTKSAQTFNDYDVILTTYGTLRNDVLMFRETQFDYLVLDEAQAIKNAASESAKSVRLLQGAHRLALSGTPVQNHLGELWSIFEFLNPGMLGTSRVFQANTGGGKTVEVESHQVLARALRPFILRRTKGQVARDLPERTEQTIFCELDVPQRKLYDELREHYRHALIERVERDGLNKSKIQILEALLRLRQAACHPGLIDPAHAELGSAKLDTLLPQLMEVIEGGHKALVFSQFTSLLAIVRARLDRENIRYEYLDGKTRDRAAPVQRFQTTDDCRIFLISLKAGGLGLNLTAAEYVFLLDPWWNPAVEAQAIDRAHRIGQVNHVFAYRLIARNTVEEKVVQLQESKRELADAIIRADNSLISRLGRDELELLLS